MAYFELRPESGRLNRDAVPLAIVRSNDGELDGQILYLHDGDEDAATVASTPAAVGGGGGAAARPPALDMAVAASRLRRLKPRAREAALYTMRHAAMVDKGADDLPEPIRGTYARLREDSRRRRQTSVHLPPGSIFEPLPTTSDDATKRSTFYIAAPSGAGKTYAVCGLIRRYAALHPGNRTYVVCKTDIRDDPAYASLRGGARPVQIPMAELTRDEPIDLTAMFDKQPCLLVLDDVDSFDSKAERAAVAALTKDALNLGRKLGVSVIITSHLLTDYARTRGTIFECANVILFPKATMHESIAYFCAKLGLTKAAIASLRGYGRWVLIRKVAPMCLLGEHEARLLE